MRTIALLSRIAAAVSLALAAAPSIAGPADLTALPVPTAATNYAIGLTDLPRGAVLYRPASAAEGAAPLVVALHGAGQSATEMLDALRPAADRRGFLLLALKSRGQSWDLVPDAGRAPEFGADVAAIDAVLGQLFAHAAVNPRRVVLLGFSDGASLALSLGTANPRLFHGIVALSPGFFVEARSADGRQRVFVTHGTNDRVIAFDHSETVVMGLLREAGAQPLFRRHTGRHEIEPRSLDAGLDYTLGRPKRAP